MPLKAVFGHNKRCKKNKFSLLCAPFGVILQS